MKILVTGATGFIGNHVLKILQEKDVQIIATGRDVEKFKSQQWNDKVIFKPYDLSINQDGSIYDYFERPDKLIHLAWAGLPQYKKLFHFEEELPKQYCFLKRLIEEGLKDITVTGTCFEYGMKERELNESLVSDPKNPYAYAKDSLRKQLFFLQETNEFELKWARLFYMYGEGQNKNSILAQLQKAIDDKKLVFDMSKGEQLRDYMAVEEVANCIINIAFQNEIVGLINVSSGVPISIKNLVEHFIKKQNANITLNLGYYPYNDYEPFAFWGENSKIKQINSNESNRTI